MTAAEVVRLYLDEKAHLSIVQYQKRLVRQNPKLFGEVAMDAGEVAQLAQRVDEFLWSKRTLSLRQAVWMALEFEESAAENHFKTAIQQANPGVSSMIRGLGQSDEHHLAGLRDFATRRKFLPGP